MKKLILIMMFVLSLAMAGNALAAGTNFDGTVSDDWHNAANWSNGLPGGFGDGGWEPILADCVIYSGNTGTLSDHSNIYGADFTLQASATLQHADPADTTSYFGLAGGTMNLDGTANLNRMNLCAHVAGDVTITGNVTLNQWSGFGFEATSAQLTVNVNGGSLDIRGTGIDFRPLTGGTVKPIFNIAGGEFIVSGNITDIADAINGPENGIIQAYGSAGVFDYAYNAGDDYTVITAVPEPATLTLLALSGLALIRRKR